MSIAITNGIKIEIEASYSFQYSNPRQEHHIFFYEISIENFNNHIIRLLKRKWFIHHCNGYIQEIDGKGVVGETPSLKPNEVFSYVSGANLKTSIGKMYGYYTMIVMDTQKVFKVTIPEITLIAPYHLN